MNEASECLPYTLQAEPGIVQHVSTHLGKPSAGRQQEEAHSAKALSQTSH